jgi:gamma-glutamylcyclotransferase (GGCT)/AIG2-like uncharacterized protein YtfP
MGDYLFVYGTLMPGCEPAAMRETCAGMEIIGPGTVRGVLYDLGSYPGIVEGEGSVRGVVVRVPAGAWPALDRYEGCPGCDDGLFRRIRTTATLDSGQSLECWIYVYARDVHGRTAVASGDWRRHRGML